MFSYRLVLKGCHNITTHDSPQNRVLITTCQVEVAEVTHTHRAGRVLLPSKLDTCFSCRALVTKYITAAPTVMADAEWQLKLYTTLQARRSNFISHTHRKNVQSCCYFNRAQGKHSIDSLGIRSSDKRKKLCS